MGCGKSKHDVASDNTILQRKKSSVNSKAGQENGTETKDNNVDNIVSSEVEQKNNENVKELGGGGKADESDDVKGNALAVQENKALEKKSNESDDVAEGKTEEIVVAKEPSEKSEGEKEDSLKDKDAPAAAEEEKKAENQKGVQRVTL